MSWLAAHRAAALLADSDGDKGKGSPIGLFVVLILLLAIYFLYRSMNRQLAKVPVSFEPISSLDTRDADTHARETERLSADDPGSAATSEPDDFSRPAGS